ncbi:MAG: ECF transporter S component, partial [Lachnospiraceae bacterium]|nr:ECF transporter S component [Lachnospiraceae bacterium]
MNNKLTTKHLVGLAVLTAIVIVLQFLGSFIRFGVFSISLVLIPIVVGAALYGPLAGAWLGLAFGVAVLLSGDAAAFLAINVPGTLITVLVKGALAGLCAGAVYYALADQASRQPGAKHNNYPAVIAAAIVCPVVNTGIF